MNYNTIFSEIKKKQSFLCIGLDADIEKIPSFLKKKEFPLFEFNKQIIDSTHDIAISYKLNTAFYESMGVEGWKNLELTANYIKKNYPSIFLIADAKRGDIGNTSEMYARCFFKTMNFDAVTVAPYMGFDSVKPFLGFENKWVILLALTSNSGATDFQYIQEYNSGKKVFERVLETATTWANKDQLMFVVGATKAEMLNDIRKIVPDYFLLVPGVGAQGGDLEQVSKNGMNTSCGLLVNSSRAIIYADSTEKFALVAREKATENKNEMQILLRNNNII